MFRFLARFLGGGLIDIGSPNGGIGQDRHHAGLHLEEAARHVVDMLFAILADDANRPRLERGEQRRVAIGHPQLPQVPGSHQHFDQAGEDLLLGADDVAMNCH